MARPSGGDNPVTLFPFLSILACVIGTLILLISSVAVMQMESDPDEDLIARVEEYQELEEQQKAMEQNLQAMLPKLHELEQYKEALKKLEEIAEELRKQQKKDPSQIKQQQEELKRLLAELKKLEEALAKEQKKEESREKTLDELREELKRRRMVLDAPTVTVMPSEDGPGGAGRRRPVFVEVNATGLVLDPGAKRVEVPRARITSDSGFKKVVDEVAKDTNKVLVILIRETGAASYRVAEQFARQNQARVAILPILGDGKLDLSRF